METIVLSQRDIILLIETLEDPPEPTEDLMSLFE